MVSAAGAALRRLCRLLCGVLWVWCVMPCHDWPSHTPAASAKQKQTLLCSALRSCGTPHPFAHHPATATSVFRLLHLHSRCHAPCVLVRSCCLPLFWPAGRQQTPRLLRAVENVGGGEKSISFGSLGLCAPEQAFSPPGDCEPLPLEPVQPASAVCQAQQEGQQQVTRDAHGSKAQLQWHGSRAHVGQGVRALCLRCDVVCGLTREKLLYPKTSTPSSMCRLCGRTTTISSCTYKCCQQETVISTVHARFMSLMASAPRMWGKP
jgi:hypothetical protein